MAIYIGLVLVDPSVVDKLNRKHNVTEAEVKEALQWPARIRGGWEEDPEHGKRWVTIATVASGREMLAALLPSPAWADEQAETWVVKSARWV